MLFRSKTGNFEQGTCSLKYDASRLANKLWVKGGKAISEPYTQLITVGGNTPIQLFYRPRAPVDTTNGVASGIAVTVNGVQCSVGIEHITPPGSKDFLLNYSEKLLIPDLVTSGNGTIIYSYEYPIKILLEDSASQDKYGVLEDTLTVDTDDRLIALQIGLNYMSKYTQPLLTGSVSPFKGIYKPGEIISIEVPDLNISTMLKIQSVDYTSDSVTAKVYRQLQLESLAGDIKDILKD